MYSSPFSGKFSATNQAGGSISPPTKSSPSPLLLVLSMVFLFVAMVLKSAGAALVPPLALTSRAEHTRRGSSPTMASFAADFNSNNGRGGSIDVVRDALMARSVEVQIAVFGHVRERGLQVWLQEQWDEFLEPEGSRRGCALRLGTTACAFPSSYPIATSIGGAPVLAI